MIANSADTDAAIPDTPGAVMIVGLVGAAFVGLGLAHAFGLHHVYESPGYLYAVTALLAIGIYSATSGIDLSQLRSRGRTVLLAITVGVLAKAALIAVPMFALVTRDPVYAVLLSVAMAQIDPLAVAALVGNSRMSESAKTILRAWSSFDDPVTMLLTIYLLAFAPGSARVLATASVSGTAGTSPVALLVSLGANLLFAAGAYVGHRLLRRLPDRLRSPVTVVFLLVAGYFAVAYFLLFGLAIVGLYLRAEFGKALDHLARGALLLATAALGLVLAGGVRWVPGLVLGASAYGAQVVTAPVVAHGQRGTDRVYLALSQQNGITAITLALLLEPVYPGTVSIIGPAILVVNLTHAAANAILARRAPAAVPVPPRLSGSSGSSRKPTPNAARRSGSGFRGSPASPAPDSSRAS